MESNHFLLSLLLVVLISASTSTATYFSGYLPIKDLKNPYVVEIAKFALSEHNKEASTKLVLTKIVSGEKHIAAGTNYKLVIDVFNVVNHRSGDYQVIVYDKPWAKIRRLASFVGVN